MDNIPEGCTHFSDFCGNVTFYSKTTEKLISNNVEEHLRYEKWYYWESGKWIPVGSGFSSRRCVGFKAIPAQ